MIKMVICGCFGRMGLQVIDETEKWKNIAIVAGIDKKKRDSDKFPVFENANDINIDYDVILDFSNVSSLGSLLNCGLKNKKPLVICTTGYSEDQIDKIKEYSNEIPIFFSGNMSIGISVLVYLSKIAKNMLGKQFDIEIIEKHHNKKVDSPSGTSMMIYNAVSEEDTNLIFDRSKIRKERSQNEIGIHSIRCGGIKGEHEIIFASENEVLSIKHVAGSRRIFAEGALKAVSFIVNQKSGLYEMKDMLNN